MTGDEILPDDETEAIAPSLEKVIARRWDSLNTHRDPKMWWARFRDWLEFFPKDVLH